MQNVIGSQRIPIRVEHIAAGYVEVEVARQCSPAEVVVDDLG